MQPARFLSIIREYKVTVSPRTYWAQCMKEISPEEYNKGPSERIFTDTQEYRGFGAVKSHLDIAPFIPLVFSCHNAEYTTVVHGHCPRGAAGVSFPLHQAWYAQKKSDDVSLYAGVHICGASH